MASVRSHVFLSWLESKDVELEGKPGLGGAAVLGGAAILYGHHKRTHEHHCSQSTQAGVFRGRLPKAKGGGRSGLRCDIPL